MHDVNRGITCARCVGRIDDGAIKFKKKLHEKTGTPYTPPKICTDCLLDSMHTFISGPEEQAP